ncbi:tyrosine-type recombinase/integrase [Ancylomarina sp. YFZ004]
MNITSDYLEFDQALNVGKKLLSPDSNKCVIAFFIIASINVGLRGGDLLSIKHSAIQMGELVLNEQKTGKKRIITLNENVTKAYSKLLEITNNRGVKSDNYIFVSQKGCVFKLQSINVLLKQIFKSKKLNISSTSLRKTFSRRVYQNNNESEASLVLLSDILNHSSTAITRRYLGIRQEEISNVYLTL